MANSLDQEKDYQRQLEKVKKDSLLNQVNSAQTPSPQADSQKTDSRQKKEYDPKKWKENIKNNNASKRTQAKQVIDQGAKAAQGISALRKKRDIGVIGGILFFILIIFATIIDVLPFITGDFSSLVDWIVDAIFFFSVFIVLVITTGDIIGSFIGRRSVVNFIQTILEFFPLIDLIPFHILATVIIYLDVKYEILKLGKKLKAQTN